jgi:hypothetical protein
MARIRRIVTDKSVLIRLIRAIRCYYESQSGKATNDNSCYSFQNDSPRRIQLNPDFVYLIDALINSIAQWQN